MQISTAILKTGLLAWLFFDCTGCQRILRNIYRKWTFNMRCSAKSLSMWRRWMERDSVQLTSENRRGKGDKRKWQQRTYHPSNVKCSHVRQRKHKLLDWLRRFCCLWAWKTIPKRSWVVRYQNINSSCCAISNVTTARQNHCSAQINEVQCRQRGKNDIRMHRAFANKELL